MGGIASAIIIPPSGSVLERVIPGSHGEESFRRISAVPRIPPAREDGRNPRARPDADDGARSRGRDGREIRQLVVRAGAEGGTPRGPEAAGPVVRGAEPVALQSFGGAAFASSHFLAQMLGQAGTPAGGPLAAHRDGAALGSDAYRRAGAAPPHYSEQPTVFRLAV